MHHQEEYHHLCHQKQDGAQELFPGVTAAVHRYQGSQISCRHQAESDLLEINYCRRGRIGWNMKNGCSIYLGPGDFSIHTLQLCADSTMTLPGGFYEGLSVCVDIRKFDSHPPDLLRETGITGSVLAEKFCPKGSFTVFTEHETAESIFDGFFHHLRQFQKPWFTLKTLELLLYLGGLDTVRTEDEKKYRSEQVETIHKVHDYLLQHMDQRITIDELARRYLMNTTTLKSVFKAVYGDSLASHIKGHRMEQAAALLRKTTHTVAEISAAVGYSSQSKFSAAFRETYEMLPLEYRKVHGSLDTDRSRGE